MRLKSYIWERAVEEGGRYFPHYPVSYTMGTGSFPGIERPGRGVIMDLHQAPRLNNKYTQRLSNHGLF